MGPPGTTATYDLSVLITITSLFQTTSSTGILCTHLGSFTLIFVCRAGGFFSEAHLSMKICSFDNNVSQLHAALLILWTMELFGNDEDEHQAAGGADQGILSEV